MNELKLNEFRIIYTNLKRNIIWWDHLLLGLLVWLEKKFIEYKTVKTVDAAIEQYKQIEPALPDYVTPIYTEKPAEGSTRLPEMRLSAPWYVEVEEEVKPVTDDSKGVWKF